MQLILDFVEAFMGKYVCGCATFVKIQLRDGPFHEDMGYCHAEGAAKGLSIQYARAVRSPFVTVRCLR